MAKASHPSLKRLLIGRLLTWQVAALLLIAASIITLLYFADDRSRRILDTGIADVIADAIIDQPQGLALTRTEPLARLQASTPPLWFVVVDAEGRRLTSGDIPPEMSVFADTLDDISRLNIQNDQSGADSAALEVEGSAAGDLKILFGGGPPPNLWLSLLAFTATDVTPFVILTLTAMGALTFIVVPRIITQSLAGLEEVVKQASTINVDKRGIRLPADEVPAEVAPLVEAVNAALARLDHGYARQERFLADAAHELKTPIAILQNRLELAGDRQPGDRVLLDVRRLSNLADQLLDLQRLANQGIPLQSVDLVALCQSVIADLAPIALDANYEPAFVSVPKALFVTGDFSAIERAVINLFQNAIAHGGGKGTIELRVQADYTIEISDEGQGIPDDRRDWVFEPFHRIRPQDRGAGLGLSLVRDIMRRHDGSVSVTTSKGGGAKFVMRFPQPDGHTG